LGREHIDPFSLSSVLLPACLAIMALLVSGDGSVDHEQAPPTAFSTGTIQEQTKVDSLIYII
jgi:hypothetical protein